MILNDADRMYHFPSDRNHANAHFKNHKIRREQYKTNRFRDNSDENDSDSESEDSEDNDPEDESEDDDGAPSSGYRNERGTSGSSSPSPLAELTDAGGAPGLEEIRIQPAASEPFIHVLPTSSITCGRLPFQQSPEYHAQHQPQFYQTGFKPVR
ncbi:hypothetical protein B0H13DRAFT_2433850 [Mycena leptocephala]|nr:hypothetical protein B0H13DRAFT_2433850 [Mycena leptocephala]